jgi:twitching motility two-component system response regulator PilG
MSTSTVSADLRQGIASARSGHRLLARLHLAEAIDADPSNDAHWLWMAWVAESPGAAVEHLQTALEKNPGNEIARAGLIWAQTMAEWDFERSLSPRATLAAVAEREGKTPASTPYPIRMPRLDELHADSSRGYDEPAKELDEPTPEPAAERRVAAEDATDAERIDEAPKSKAEIDLPAEPSLAARIEKRPPSASRPPSGSRPASGTRPPSATLPPESHLTATRPPSAAGSVPDPARPDSIPIDQLTGMFTGEGRQLVGDLFPGFDMSMSAVDVVNDPSASLATPFPGGMTVGKVSSTRPPSADLASPFGAYEPKDLEAPAVASDSDFETITPTKLAADEPPADIPVDVPMVEAYEPAPVEEPAGRVDEPSTPSLADFAPPAGTTPPADAGHGDSKGRKILIVDDSPTVCKIVSITLKKRGYDVQSAGDGVEAMALVASNKPDLILLDITMPRMDGYQLCKLIKGYPETKAIPVIMLSGKDGFFDRVRGKLVGCSDYITKPFDPEMLVATVDRFLPQPAAAAAL